jgi:hypothetical protein
VPRALSAADFGRGRLSSRFASAVVDFTGESAFFDAAVGSSVTGIGTSRESRYK